MRTLSELGVDKDRMVYALNKSDLLENTEIKEIRHKNNKKTNANASERQSAIVEFIRQFPSDCRMKDLNAEFIDVSERTLRNDIQFLIENELVERLGGKSGPSSYFVVVDKSDSLESSLPDKILLPETTQF